MAFQKTPVQRLCSLCVRSGAIGCALLLTSIYSSPQRCTGNINTGCSNPGAVCSPVNSGIGSAGKCQTGPQPAGEKECQCVGQPYPPQPRTYGFDILTQGTDANGFLLNPVWVSQVDTVTGPPSLAHPPFGYANCYPNPWDTECTTWHPTKVDQGLHRPECGVGAQSTFGGFGRGQYHYNWADATYEGRIKYDEFANDDNDINFILDRGDNAGDTSWNENGIGLEFDATETVAHFPTTWWKKFWDAASLERFTRDIDPSKYADAKNVACNMFRKTPAAPGQACLPNYPDHSNIDGIVIGALGLDCVHSCGSEIHPVFAIALHVKDDPNDDTWAIFTRNFGNEGYCSDGSLYRPQYNKIFITLPWRLQQGIIATPLNAYGNAELVSSEAQGWSASGKPTSVSVQVKHLAGILIGVTSEAPVVPPGLFDIRGAYWAEFELHFKWTGAQPLQALSAQQRDGLLGSQIGHAPKTISAQPEKETEPEKRDLGLSAADRKARQDILQHITPVQLVPVTVKVVSPSEPMGREVVRTSLGPIQPSTVQSQIIRDPQKDEAQKRAADILQKAHPTVSH